MERQILFMEVSTWARFFAWLHIVSSLCGTMSFIYVVYIFERFIVLWATIFFIIVSMLCALNFVMSLLFLIGSVHGHAHYVKAWLVFNSMLTITSLGLIVIAATCHSQALLIFLLFAIPAFFSLYTVGLHLKEIQSSEFHGEEKFLEVREKQSVLVTDFYNRNDNYYDIVL